MEKLGLAPTGTVTVVDPYGKDGPHEAPTFDVCVGIQAAPDQEMALFPNLRVVATELLRPQGFEALLGRDVLSRCLLIYDGPGKTFTLSY